MVQPILFVTSRHCIGILYTCTCGMDVVNKIKILTFSTQQQAKEMTYNWECANKLQQSINHVHALACIDALVDQEVKKALDG